ncbi:hypothetical protein JL722_15127 [Aureococcus anophagefferens]|nr:hypothetical protein JL722_15127 [Aureococcus anophagefferens]
MPEEQSRPLSPFKTYREFVATQRDDADPQTFSRRYQDYRGTFAKELVRRFFERNADFEWFRGATTQRASARSGAQRAAEAAAFRRTSTTPRASSRAAPRPGGGARGGGAREGADAVAFGSRQVLLDDAAPRRKDGFDVDAWLLFDDADAARDAEKALGDGRLDVAVPPALAASPPWDPACARAATAGGAATTATPGPTTATTAPPSTRRGAASPRRWAASSERLVQRALLSASVGAVDEFGRGAGRGPRPYDRAGAALGSRDRLARDCAQALAAAAAYDDAADVPGGDRLAALVAGDTALGAALRADNGACLDVAAAYLRRVHLVLYYGATRCKDEIDLLTRDVAWLTRPARADAPGSPDEEAEKLAAATADLAARLEAKARPRAPKAPAKTTTAARRRRQDWGKVLADMDDALCRLIAAAREAAGGARTTVRVCPGRAYHPRGAAARLFAAENAAVDRATEAFYAETGAAEDNGRARCGFEWCRKLFKSQDFLRKHGANRHGDYLEQFVTAARRPFMWAVYELDGQKPLPPIRTDAGAEVEPSSSSAARPTGSRAATATAATAATTAATTAAAADSKPFLSGKKYRLVASEDSEDEDGWISSSDEDDDSSDEDEDDY